MKTIALSKRVDIVTAYEERRDALDQRWIFLLKQAGLLAVPVPNCPEWLDSYLEKHSFDGVLLTGGNSLVRYGGNAPERDALEARLLDHALNHDLPVLGVCRGMQVLLDRFGTLLHPVKGHVAAEQEIEIEGKRSLVNSYHDWGTSSQVVKGFNVWARADDGIIKAVRHLQRPLWGIMWHPERCSPFRSEDLLLLRRVFT